MTETTRIKKWSSRNIRNRLAYLISRLEAMVRPVDPPGSNLSGDRDIEWSWVLSHMGKGPGKAMDLGSGWSLILSTTAAFRGYDVLALDRNHYQHPFISKSVTLKKADILTETFPDNYFDLLIACSTIEHIGLPERYGSEFLLPNADLEVMQKLLAATKPNGSFILTIPVGVDAVFIPRHRIYGESRLPKLLNGWKVKEECYWLKKPDDNWESVHRSEAVTFQGSERIYGIGCFELIKEVE